MIKYFAAALICLCASLGASAQSQMDLNQDAYSEYKKAENEINRVYQRILKEYTSDAEFIKNLRSAQRLWVQFRDAEVKAMYPNREPGYYGSVQPMCVSMFMTRLTNERIKTLSVWLTGIPEGDVCSGSIKTKQ